MITINIAVDTDESGKLSMRVHAEGIGTLKETDIAVAIVELSNAAFDIATLADGGNPRTTLDPRNRITPLGQG